MIITTTTASAVAARTRIIIINKVFIKWAEYSGTAVINSAVDSLQSAFELGGKLSLFRHPETKCLIIRESW